MDVICSFRKSTSKKPLQRWCLLLPHLILFQLPPVGSLCKTPKVNSYFISHCKSSKKCFTCFEFPWKGVLWSVVDLCEEFWYPSNWKFVLFWFFSQNSVMEPTESCMVLANVIDINHKFSSVTGMFNLEMLACKISEKKLWGERNKNIEKNHVRFSPQNW